MWSNTADVLDQLEVPIVQAPLAGGPSTPALAAAVCDAGGLGFVAAGYKSIDALRQELDRTRELTSRPFGVNVFVPGRAPTKPDQVASFAATLQVEADRAGVPLGPPRFDDDGFQHKLELLAAAPAGVVSFTFGCPPASALERLRQAGSSVWVTVTSLPEARQAAQAGADALVIQGSEAGGHSGSFVDSQEAERFGLLALLQLVGAEIELPLVAAGGIATGRGVAAVLVAGASAAQIGTAFMRCPEAATSPPHREALATARRTGLTRAFTGRLARGIVNRFQAEHSEGAPIAYPELHHVTAPLRARGRETGDAELINLWAGQSHELALELPAAEIVARLASEARAALDAASPRLRRAAASPG